MKSFIFEMEFKRALGHIVFLVVKYSDTKEKYVNGMYLSPWYLIGFETDNVDYLPVNIID